MGARAEVSHAPWTERHAVPVTIVVGLGAAGMGAAFARLNTRYAAWAFAVTGAESRLWQGLLFSALPLVVALVVAAPRPRLFGLQVGDSLLRWRLVLGVTATLCAVVGLALTRLPSNPFSGADAVVQVVAVPVSEELLFRGVLFSAVLWALRRWHDAGRSLHLTVLITGVAFGLAHLNNLGSYDATFVVLQAVNATVLGVAAGHLRGATRSVLPAVVLHAAVNAVALL